MNPELVVIILGMSAVSFVPRFVPLFFLSGKRLPAWFREWLDLIPVAILSALLLPALVVSGEPAQMDWLNLKSVVAIPTLAFALKTRSLGGTIILGMALYWGAGVFLG